MASTKIPSKKLGKIRQLAKMMNKQNIEPIPITGQLIKCFDVALDDAEIDLLLKVKDVPRTYEEIVAFAGLPVNDFYPFFKNMMNKGLLWIRPNAENEDRFHLSPILLGWFEVFLADGKETPQGVEFSKQLEKYFQTFKKMNFFPVRNLVNLGFRKMSKPMRSIAVIDTPKHGKEKTNIIPINHKLDKESRVYPTTRVTSLIEKHGRDDAIALIHCLCRQWHKMIDEPCRFDMPTEGCMVLGGLTKQIVDYGIGRYIKKDEALELIHESQKKGAVHIVFYDREDINSHEVSICSCCWDCCAALGSHNKGMMPLYFRSHYYAYIADATGCKGCEKCSKYCPTNAITIIDKKSIINDKRCIGCGQCAFQCPTNAIELEYKERDVFLPLQKKSELRL